MPTRTRSQGASVSLIGGVLTLAFGLLLMFQGACEIVVGRLVATQGVGAEGLVVGKQIRERRGRRGSGGPEHEVAYRFTAASGAELAGRAVVARARWERLTEHGPVAVSYLPRAPWLHRVEGDERGFWPRRLGFIIVGGVVAAIGGLGLFASRLAP
jgi:hypothetical protein